ncbi:hypothetical protein ADIS_4771 [Lunatimonas lonarensis]|uniref:Uncharacterized protein n=1 Tax=Lunatimonas lonarensis TaxID=1232681 RepID=R7ZL32_9BACT|nr:hypothetical protein ADIS_4771 [Lunatimonas lonarensis]
MIELRTIRFLEGELIEVAALRRLYTNMDWVELEIVSVYRRYTKVT